VPQAEGDQKQKRGTHQGRKVPVLRKLWLVARRTNQMLAERIEGAGDHPTLIVVKAQADLPEG
jgi:hypothetical protein